MTITNTTFFNRPAHQLVNDHFSLIIVPSLAGRVMELIVSEKNFLWINEPLLKGAKVKGWKNWGGYKTWIAPQSKWKKIDLPDEQMDQSEWHIVGVADSAAATSIELRSPLIKWAGVVLNRRVTLRAREAKIFIRESILNASDANQTWALWGVAQFPVPGVATFPNDAIKNIRKLHGKPHEFKAKKLKFDGDSKWKVGALTSEGWGTYQAKGWRDGITVRFSASPNHPHADESNLEAWSNSNPDYMELEWLSPLMTLKPGEERFFETQWEIRN